MSEGNGKIVDEGLTVINWAFEGAKYLSAEAKECAELMKLGKHREQEVNDATAIEMFAMVTEGKKFQLTRQGNSGKGYSVCIESYADLRDFLNGTIEATEIRT